MSQGPDAGTPDSSPREALEKAREALIALESNQSEQRELSRPAQLAIIAVVVASLGGLVVHTFFEDKAPQVDNTSVALLILALAAPYVSRLKVLEVGGAKAEWQVSAAVGLKEVIQLAGMQQDAITKLYDEVSNRATTESGSSTEENPPSLNLEESFAQPIGADVFRPIRTVLWVDDHPENNGFELENLRKLFTVHTARNNDDAAAILHQEQIDAVISDIGRDDDVPGEDPGGVKLGEQLRASEKTRGLPIIYYTTRQAIQANSRRLREVGASGATTLFSEVLQVLRRTERTALERSTLATAGALGTVSLGSTPDSPDVVVTLRNGTKVGIEMASWLRRPQMAAFADRVGRLTSARDAGAFEHGILVTRIEMVDDRRLDWARERNVMVVGPESLGDALNKIG